MEGCVRRGVCVWSEGNVWREGCTEGCVRRGVCVWSEGYGGCGGRGVWREGCMEGPGVCVERGVCVEGCGVVMCVYVCRRGQ